MLRHARDLRRDATDAESHIWRCLRRRQLGGAKFRRQHRIGLYICDFACVEASLIVELDGSQHVDRQSYDDRRDAFLRSAGFRVLRFWNNDALERTEQVLDTIFEALNRREIDGRLD
ncbi:MAG: DUF559 domain-containing protein [Reyranella sp.]|uniref:endonuclease domain-containing protein n=1 Tax=Reyranella sp. TaxID=1929291 RepID=UPI0025FD4DFF|nr:DUF559 domain-containing protein [Reyranella sp.]MBR2813815.1 DUF559 domain-containing protein [Reyranella sp.]